MRRKVTEHYEDHEDDLQDDYYSEEEPCEHDLIYESSATEGTSQLTEDEALQRAIQESLKVSRPAVVSLAKEKGPLTKANLPKHSEKLKDVKSGKLAERANKVDPFTANKDAFLSILRDQYDEHRLKFYHRQFPLYLSVIGHVDSGKSTFLGHFSHLSKNFTAKEQEGNHKASSNHVHQWAWLLDTNEEERTRGITMDLNFYPVSLSTHNREPSSYSDSMASPNSHFLFVDTPGHDDFLGKLITGLCLTTPNTLFLLDASKGSFEAAFSKGSNLSRSVSSLFISTQERLRICQALQIDHLIFLVNKMDTVDWSIDRFYYIKDTIQQFMHKVLNYSPKFVRWVLLDANNGIGLVGKGPVNESLYTDKILPSVDLALSELTRYYSENYNNAKNADSVLSSFMSPALSITNNLVFNPLIPFSNVALLCQLVKLSSKSHQIDVKILSGVFFVNSPVLCLPTLQQCTLKAFTILSESSHDTENVPFTKIAKVFRGDYVRWTITDIDESFLSPGNLFFSLSSAGTNVVSSGIRTAPISETMQKAPTFIMQHQGLMSIQLWSDRPIIITPGSALRLHYWNLNHPIRAISLFSNKSRTNTKNIIELKEPPSTISKTLPTQNYKEDLSPFMRWLNENSEATRFLKDGQQGYITFSIEQSLPFIPEIPCILFQKNIIIGSGLLLPIK